VIPQLVTVRYRRQDGRWRRLYVPILPVLLVLSPLLVICLLGGVTACLIFRVSPVGGLRGIGQVLWALPGARIELDDGQAALHISVR
jgi:hypothetical protein